MKKILTFICLVSPFFAFATRALTIGENTFSVEFENIGCSDSFRNLVVEDMEKVFFPLRHITNVVDASFLLSSPNKSGSIIHREWYPEGFEGGVSVTNHAGSLTFRVSAILSRRYADAFQNLNAISNKVSKLNELILSLNDGSITNRTDTEIQSLVFNPSGADFSFTTAEAREFFREMSLSGPFSVSALDFWNERIHENQYTAVAVKTACLYEGGLEFVPVVWLYSDEKWMYCHPAALEATVRGETTP